MSIWEWIFLGWFAGGVLSGFLFVIFDIANNRSYGHWGLLHTACRLPLAFGLWPVLLLTLVMISFSSAKQAKLGS